MSKRLLDIDDLTPNKCLLLFLKFVTQIEDYTSDPFTIDDLKETFKKCPNFPENCSKDLFKKIEYVVLNQAQTLKENERGFKRWKDTLPKFLSSAQLKEKIKAYEQGCVNPLDIKKLALAYLSVMKKKNGQLELIYEKFCKIEIPSEVVNYSGQTHRALINLGLEFFAKEISLAEKSLVDPLLAGLEKNLMEYEIEINTSFYKSLDENLSWLDYPAAEEKSVLISPHTKIDVKLLLLEYFNLFTTGKLIFSKSIPPLTKRTEIVTAINQINFRPVSTGNIVELLVNSLKILAGRVPPTLGISVDFYASLLERKDFADFIKTQLKIEKISFIPNPDQALTTGPIVSLNSNSSPISSSSSSFLSSLTFLNENREGKKEKQEKQEKQEKDKLKTNKAALNVLYSELNSKFNPYS